MKNVTKQTKQHIIGEAGRGGAECTFDQRRWPGCRYGDELPKSECPNEENSIRHSKIDCNQIFRR